MAGLGLGSELRDFPGLCDPQVRIDLMDRHRVDMQVLTLSTPALGLFGPEQRANCREAARIANDGIAEIATARPDRFIGAATLPLMDPEAAAREFERAVLGSGLKGVQIFSHVGGKPLDDPEFFPIYQLICEHDVPVLLHPAGGDYNVRTRDYMIWLTFGWPFETSIAMARLVYGGVLERFPRLKIVAHHLGAFVPSLRGRILSISANMEKSGRWKLPQPALSYFKRFYGDTAVYGHQGSLADGYDFFGPDRIVFGSDFPFATLEEVLPAVVNWKLEPGDKVKVLAGNARRLFKL